MATLDELTRQLFPIVVALATALLALRFGVLLSRGHRVELGTSRGSPRRGVLYSLTFSMLPWKKDGSRRHAATYLAGMGMHLGIFATLVFALGRRFWGWPERLLPLFAVAAVVGWTCSFGLFVKRASRPYMRAISSADDVVSSLLVQLWLLGAAATVAWPAAVAAWRLAAMALLLYLPLGKIFHMFLFFVSRVLFGLQFGRRGVLQHDLPLTY